MKRFTVISCPICGSSQFTRALSGVDHFASGEMFHISRCCDCSFMFTDDAPDESEIGRYYTSSSYISHSDTQEGIMNTLYHKVRQYMLSQKCELIQSCLPMTASAILDIGCGTGYFPSYMQTRGWSVTAVEKSAQARAFAKAHFNLDVLPDTDLDSLPSEDYDVITMWHVMEHIQNLDALWTTLSRLLKPSGILVIALPNPLSFDARHYGSSWAAYDLPRHLWHFTPDTIKRLAFRYGFLLDSSKPMPFDGFYVSMLTEKNEGKFLPFISGGFIGAIGCISSLLNKNESSSLIYVFRKEGMR